MNSEKLKKYLEDFRIMLAVGAVIGLALGLVIGWGIWLCNGQTWRLITCAQI